MATDTVSPDAESASEPRPEVDVPAMLALLDGRYAEMRELVRTNLAEHADILDEAETLSREDYCDRVRDLLVAMAGTGQTGMGFPQEYGGGGDIGASVAAFETLQRSGKILRWGVSNFDTHDIDDLVAVPNGDRCAVNQVLYHLGERSVEWSLAKRCERHAIAIMAYSPVGEGDLLRHPRLRAIARSIGATPAQVALAWLLRNPHVIAIPKTSNVAHVVENRAATSLALSPQTLAHIDEAFPPPSRATRLAVI